MEFLRNSSPFRSSAPNCFILAGWRADIPEIPSVADLFVHCPTTWIEGLGIAHLEAMAMGTPTVVSENGGLTDSALDGVTGFVIPQPFSGCSTTTNSPSAWDECPQKNRRTIRRPKKHKKRWKCCLQVISQESASIAKPAHRCAADTNHLRIHAPFSCA